MEQIQQILSNLWFQMVFQVVFATVHGYLAAWLAIRMLFRPRQAKKLFGLTVVPQGMIPKHRDRLAQAIGNAVGNELMSSETVTNALFGEKQFLRRKVEALIDKYAETILTHEFPSLLDALPPQMRTALLDSLAVVETHLGEYVAATLKSEETAEAVREFVDKQADKLLSRRVSETLDNETFEQALQFVESRVKGIVHEAAFESRIRTFVNARVEDVANTNTPLGEMFTPDFVQFAREKINEQVQPIIQQLTEIAASEKTKTQIASLIKTEVGEYYGQLPFYQKFFVSRDRLYKEVDELVNTTLPRKIEETLRGEAFAAEAQNFLDSAINGWMSRPLPELVGKIAPEKLENLKEQIAGTLLSLVRSGEMQSSLSAYLTDTLHNIRPHSWRAIAERIHPEAAARLKKAVTETLISVLQRDETINSVNSILGAQVDRLLVTPIGKLSNHISAETVRDVSDALADKIVAAAEERLPAVIQEFDIATLVREKVDAYPLEKLETLVLSIAGQHLRTIEFFGLIIGFFLGVGLALFLWIAPPTK
jgi:uncharacterized membrane protein YheB (UPF0754 family)